MLLQSDAQTALKIISIVAIVFGSLYGLGGLAMIVGAIVLFSTNELMVFSYILFGIAGFALLAATALIVGGIGGLQKKAWCKIPLFIGAGVSLANLPLGTVFAVAVIWLLGTDETVQSLLK